MAYDNNNTITCRLNFNNFYSRTRLFAKNIENEIKQTCCKRTRSTVRAQDYDISSSNSPKMHKKCEKWQILYVIRFCVFVAAPIKPCSVDSSRKHLRTKGTPDLHLKYSKNGGYLGLVLNDKKGNFSIKSYVVAIY